MDHADTTYTHCIANGIRKGWSGFVWVLQILVPVSFLTVLLDYSGWINSIDFLLEPVMGLLRLPPMAAFPLVVGVLTGIYGGIASMTALPLSNGQMTLIAVFLLISHNLIQEGIIQAKSGSTFLKTTVFRLAASVITVSAIAPFLDGEPVVIISEKLFSPASHTFTAVLKSWGASTLYLCAKIFAIIMVIMILLETMKRYNVVDRIVGVLTPFLKIMGLDRQVGILWLTAAVFGIAYGGAVIVEETKQGSFTREELEKLHLSIGINHAVFEDPALFLALGLGSFWLWIPRFITAIIAVHLYNLITKMNMFSKPSTPLPVSKNKSS
ncbi:MAG: iron transporter [Pseudomonadota bacterium]